MRHALFVILPLITTALFGQTAAEADKVRATLQGAGISKPIVKTRILFFSDPKKQDTIILSVPGGLISQSNSSLQIKTADNKIIFDKRIKTYYFIRGIFLPDSIPHGGQEVYDSYINKYVTSLTKEKFENYAKTKINAFLEYNTLSKAELSDAKLYGTVIDKEVYKKVFTESHPKVIWFPCFECDEGASYFAYSAKRAKAIEFLVTD
jgi:hypothetical protein